MGSTSLTMAYAAKPLIAGLSNELIGVGACEYASGSHVCNPNIAIFTHRPTSMVNTTNPAQREPMSSTSAEISYEPVRAYTENTPVTNITAPKMDHSRYFRATFSFSPEP